MTTQLIPIVLEIAPHVRGNLIDVRELDVYIAFHFEGGSVAVRDEMHGRWMSEAEIYELSGRQLGGLGIGAKECEART